VDAVERHAQDTTAKYNTIETFSWGGAPDPPLTGRGGVVWIGEGRAGKGKGKGRREEKEGGRVRKGRNDMTV